jgi:hypothetical protein
VLARRPKYHYDGIPFGITAFQLSRKFQELKYSFRKIAGESETTLLLDDYAITITKDGTPETISYASITSVRICRPSLHIYRVYLLADGHKPLVIRSQSFDETGKQVDQSSGYALFVRVLHHHLKEKSSAVFTSGGNIDRVWQGALVSGVFSFLISIVAGYFGYDLMNAYIQALIFAVLAAIMIVAFGVKKLPRHYKPGDIPLRFLP